MEDVPLKNLSLQFGSDISIKFSIFLQFQTHFQNLSTGKIIALFARKHHNQQGSLSPTKFFKIIFFRSLQEFMASKRVNPQKCYAEHQSKIKKFNQFKKSPNYS